MILTKDGYESRKEDFLAKNKDDIKKLLIEEKKKYVEESCKMKDWKYFAKEYMGGFFLILIVSYFLLIKDVVTIYGVSGFVLLELIIFGYAYAKWSDEVKTSAMEAFSCRIGSLVRDFIFFKMRESVDMVENEEDFYEEIQFYSIAMYDIPRTELFIDVFHDK